MGKEQEKLKLYLLKYIKKEVQQGSSFQNNHAL